jgi:hypothetical protein
MLISNMFIYKLFSKKRKRNLQDIIVIQMYEIEKIQMHFWSNYLIFWFKFFYGSEDLGKVFQNEIYLFSFGQNMTKIIMVKVGYFCMGQRALM